MPMKIVEYQANHVIWNLADVSAHTFVNAELTNLYGTHVLHTDMSRYADLRVEHFQISEPSEEDSWKQASELKTVSEIPLIKEHIIDEASPSQVTTLPNEKTDDISEETQETIKKIAVDSVLVFHKHSEKEGATTPQTRFVFERSLFLIYPLNENNSDEALGSHMTEEAADNWQSPSKDSKKSQLSVEDFLQVKASKTKTLSKKIIQPQVDKWQQAGTEVLIRSRRAILTIRADKSAPFLKNSHPLIPCYRHLEINVFPLQIDLTLDTTKKLKKYFLSSSEEFYSKKNNKPLNKKSELLGTFSKKKQQRKDSAEKEKAKEIDDIAAGGDVQLDDLVGKRYFHRVRIGGLEFDVTFTGWLRDFKKKQISIRPFDYASRLWTWTKLLEKLGFFGGLSHTDIDANDSLFQDSSAAQFRSQESQQSLIVAQPGKKPTKVIEWLKKKSKKVRERKNFGNDNLVLHKSALLFGEVADDLLSNEYASISKDVFGVIFVDFDPDMLLSLIGGDTSTFENSTVMESLHENILVELKQCLERICGEDDAKHFFFRILKRIAFKQPRVIVAIHERAENKSTMETSRLLDTYRRCLQSLVVSQKFNNVHPEKDENATPKWFDVIKYIVAAQNIQITQISKHLQ
ncbi:hypothetical protein RFI_05313 [Reticulomyxa filosa]|uniref:Uncharacterized protein n=1 Tax=Reticulomyxa filosa TaxID=46433 RepID=X6P2M0_RETFI|nr:hypothetical protein RFI_05313 [Reticulomyxa filosa]|eukprot:ETO31807.1 hypothetical protein RFI_05313 [Reticulomyxa filosa]